MAEQGTPEWIAERLGKVTASRFHDVMTKPRSGFGLSKTAESYMLDLLAERLTGIQQGFQGNAATDWGNEQEADARLVYEAATGLSVEPVGFIGHPEYPDVGCSPDGLVGDDGGCEIKCPFNTRIHLQYLLGGALPKEHVAQVQGAMWVTGRDWWDFCSYDPRIEDHRLAMFHVMVLRDVAYIRLLQTAVCDFVERLDRNYKTLTEGLNA